MHNAQGDEEPSLSYKGLLPKRTCFVSVPTHCPHMALTLKFPIGYCLLKLVFTS